MNRAAFVVRIGGLDHDANHLSVGRRVTDSGKSVSTLSFMCSGVMRTVDASEVQGVEWKGSGEVHCSECDQSIRLYVGDGPHFSLTDEQLDHHNDLVAREKPGAEATA